MFDRALNAPLSLRPFVKEHFQLTFTCPAIEWLEKGVKYVQR